MGMVWNAVTHPVIRAILPSTDAEFNAVLPSGKAITIPAESWIVRHFNNNKGTHHDVALLPTGDLLIMETGRISAGAKVFASFKELMKDRRGYSNNLLAYVAWKLGIERLNDPALDRCLDLWRSDLREWRQRQRFTPRRQQLRLVERQ